jgi:hypothetical protein
MSWVRDLTPLACAEADGRCEGAVAIESDGTPRCRLHGRVQAEVTTALSRLRTLPKDTPPPSLRSRDEIVSYLESRMHLVEVGELDRKILETTMRACTVAMAALELEAKLRVLSANGGGAKNIVVEMTDFRALVRRD